MATIRLSSGHQMPQVGFGLWKVPNDVCAEVVYNAIKTGYRLLDGACDYGNEVECGQGVARAIKEGIVKREELFIVSKLWNSFHDGDRVEPIVKKQLADWGVDYFDLYLIHFPVATEYVDPSVRYPPGWFYEGDEIRPSKATIQETWTAMESLVEKGLSKSIGVSNFQAQLLYDLLRYAKIRPATLQVEHHPYLVQQELLNLAKKEGIAVTAYSTFGPASFKEFNMAHATELTQLTDDETIKAIAAKYNKQPSQVLLRWATQRGLAIIPKSTSPARMKENIESSNFDLSEEDIATISSFDRGLRFNQPTNYFPSEMLWIFG
ncbi:NAD(P)H-dependent D-xylose reductase-like protein [Parathielavia hyrcaniae]|uniref:NAD(P)H-dependent D-xylose reductase-like protein n=1 Tax=Parathielavia hyrcaniae TaxID=113614 RepID=A0AAN6PZA8_9PEZI|nr:NAD(P)H-dependent D-xylose reductase-like protein [Parathielavia hyrcaniae]